MIEEKVFGAIFIYDDGKNYIRFSGQNFRHEIEKFVIGRGHQEGYQRFIKRVERYKKLEKLLS